MRSPETQPVDLTGGLFAIPARSAAAPRGGVTIEAADARVDPWTFTAALYAGGPGSDVLFGSADPDLIFGYGGDDYLYGQDGGDQIYGGDGYDRIEGGAGYDTAWGEAGDDYLRGGYGEDFLYGGGDNDTLLGDDDVDRLYGDGGNDQLYGGAGAYDVLNGGDGYDFLFGEDGDDNLFGDGGGDYLNGGDGGDVLNGGTEADGLSGQAGDDFLYGDDGDDYLSGGYGVDYLNGGYGVDTVSFAGETGAFEVYVRLDSGFAADSYGNGETIVSIENAIGAGYDDVLVGDGGANVLEGRGGGDVLEGRDGDDVLDGGYGSDWAVFFYAASGVTVDLSIAGPQDTGGAGIDSLISIENLDGSDFDDVLFGDSGSNDLLGHDGADRLNGRAGADHANGGAGDDWVFVDDAGDTVVESGGDGADRVFSSVSWTMADFEEIEILSTTHQAGTAVIDLTGNNLGNTIAGNNGVNRLDGAAGADVLLGHLGDDVLIGGDGDDSFDGGGGVDTADFRGASGAVTVNLTTQAATGQGTDVVHDIEEVLGSAYADVISGAAAANTLAGGDGDDRLDGRGGVDTTIGGAGDDWHWVDDALDVVVEADLEGYADRVFAAVSYELAAGVQVETLSTSLQAGTDAIDLTGNEFGQALAGNEGVNALSGGGGDDRLLGQGGDDLLLGGEGDDHIDGGAGRDAAYYLNAAAGVTVNLTTGLAGGGAGADTLKDVEDLFGSDFNDALAGSAAANSLSGGGGDDILDGRGGSDITQGGGGDDWHFVDDIGDLVLEAAGQGTADRVFASASYALALAAEIEILTTALQAGTAAIDLTGNDFDQFVAGNNGANVLHGGGGADKVLGHGGDDDLWGDAGADRFAFNSALFGQDVVHDFEDGTELIRIEGVAGGADEFAELSIASDGAGGTLITFPDGSTITLAGVADNLITEADFEFVPFA